MDLPFVPPTNLTLLEKIESFEHPEGVGARVKTEDPTQWVHCVIAVQNHRDYHIHLGSYLPYDNHTQTPKLIKGPFLRNIPFNITPEILTESCERILLQDITDKPHHATSQYVPYFPRP